MGVENSSLLIVGVPYSDMVISEEDQDVIDQHGFHEWLWDNDMVSCSPAFDSDISRHMVGREITERDVTDHEQMELLHHEITFAVTAMRHWVRGGTEIKLMSCLDIT